MTNDTIDICPGLPRSWRWRADTIDPIVGKPLRDLFEELKHKPAVTDWDTHPNITMGYEVISSFTFSQTPVSNMLFSQLPTNLFHQK